MAHFAELDAQNKVVRVLVVPDEQEHRGRDFLADDLKLGGRWVRTSYNTRGGGHTGGGTPLRKNYAGPGMTYDAARDAFIHPKPQQAPSWVLNEQTCLWEPPVPKPNDGKKYMWDETTQQWIQRQQKGRPQ